MEGQLLYQLYVEENANLNIAVDEWEDLDECDHTVWNAMAARLNAAAAAL